MLDDVSLYALKRDENDILCDEREYNSLDIEHRSDIERQKQEEQANHQHHPENPNVFAVRHDLRHQP